MQHTNPAFLERSFKWLENFGKERAQTERGRERILQLQVGDVIFRRVKDGPPHLGLRRGSRVEEQLEGSRSKGHWNAYEEDNTR